MSLEKEITSKEAIDLKVSEDSGYASFFAILGVLLLLASICSMFGCAQASNYYGEKDKLMIVTASCLVACFNCFFASHIITILSNARWSLNHIALNTMNRESSNPLLSGVVDELKKISEQNKEQTEALKKSIEELSEKAEKTNTYLYHIYKK